MRARYYSITSARFLTEDSYLGDIAEPLTLNRYNYCISSWLNYVDPSGNIAYDNTIPSPADVMELWDLLTGEDTHEEQIREYRELQIELEYYEASASAGMFDALLSHLGYEVAGGFNALISLGNACGKVLYWLNPFAEKPFEIDMVSTEPFDNFLERNAAKVWDMDAYYTGRCSGDAVISVVNSVAMAKGIVDFPKRLEKLSSRTGSFLKGGMLQLQPVGGPARYQLVAFGEVTAINLEGVAGAGIPALLLGDAGEDFLESFAKIDKDRLLKDGGKAPEIKEIYHSLKDAPDYPDGFEPRINGTTKNKVTNRELLSKLREIEQGTWNKVYKDGYDMYGNKISIHYFQSPSGKVFDVKVKAGWSNGGIYGY